MQYFPTTGDAFRQLLGSELFGGSLWGIKAEQRAQRQKQQEIELAEKCIRLSYKEFPVEVGQMLKEAGMDDLLKKVKQDE